MSDNDSIYIPIPHFPPFKLRSSMIDKDPVIWAHLLQAYIQLMHFLLDPNSPKLNVKSQQQFQLFLKIYLQETSEESERIFSLGAINPDITKNTEILRSLVFQVIKNYSFVKLNITGEMIWNFVKIYVLKNVQTVRSLIDGNFKSKFNDNKKSGQISSISVLQKYLEQLISSEKFNNNDLSCLTTLLGQHTAKTTTFSMGSNKSVSKVSNNSLTFAESFVSVEWIENLENLYAGGKSVNAETIKNIMVLSLLSLSTTKLAKLALGLGVSSVDTLSLSPLFSAIIISESFKELIPKLEEKLQFLRQVNIDGEANEEYDDEQEEDEDGFEQNIEGISLLVDLFPDLTERKAKIILRQHNGDVEHVTNLLLENPDLINSIAEKPKQVKQQPKVKVAQQNKQIPKRSIYDDDDISKGDFSNSKITFGKKQREKLGSTNEDLKKKTLNAALRLMYESDEDEPDDTYEDQEKTSGSALDENSKNRNGTKLAVLNDEKKSAFSEVDPKERFLFSIFKKDGADAFSKFKRKSSDRSKLRKDTEWSDEQIEGWLRMLLKSPRRFKILEEDYFYGGGNPNRRNHSKKISKEDDELQLGIEESSKVSKTKTQSPTPESKDKQQQNSQSKEQVKHKQARNEKNKANKANHNRKSKHDKKSNSALIGMQSSS
ncbi:hypothetical protein KGF54_001371 [Candida jiufengensis]|uniref:uncharacterized protein n=1 Tax=Candida jiufengensis TaxID=497108 RepID=UPI00222424AE|nr:uncharacterized protein KGF54_001371 [Candida jiufengensis]KAI5955869.1 hypothetical protein KGF54_001371 [Candida jiufengensis]